MMSSLTYGSRLNYVNIAVGGLALLAVLLFIAAILQSGRVQGWIDPGQEIKIILPDEGLFGLSEGANVEILGTKAGAVSRIEIDPDQHFHAIVHVRRDMLPFVRSDSRAVIRKQFGVAGASYLEITRGNGQPLDWEYAVLHATADTSPTDALRQTLEEVRARIVPMIDDGRNAMQAWTRLANSLQDPEGNLQQLTSNLKTMTASINRGEGTLGTLITDDTLAVELNKMSANINKVLDDIDPIVENLRKTSGNVAKVTGNLATQSDDLPEIVEQLKQTLSRLQSILGDLKETTPKLPRIADNIDKATENVPGLVLQANQTLHELERLMAQLQQHWLLGGDRRPSDNDDARLKPWEQQQ